MEEFGPRPQLMDELTLKGLPGNDSRGEGVIIYIHGLWRLRIGNKASLLENI